MKNIYWDSVNKWLYLGTKEGQDNQFTILLDNWCWFSKAPTIRKWSLFDIMWDNGAWWWNLKETEKISIPYMDGKYIETADIIKKTGSIQCFIQITIVGIGFRYWYDKNMTVYHRKS